MGVGLQGSVRQIVVVDPESFPVTPDHSAESSLLCQVYVSGGPFQASWPPLISLVSDEKHEKKNKTLCVGSRWVRRG